MRMLNRLGLLALIGVVVVSACDDDETGPTPERYTATLSGANETPPVTTTAAGTATFTVNGNNLDYTVNITNWPAGRTVTAAHIHCAPPAGQTTCPPLKGWPAGSITTTGGSGTIALSDAELAGIRGGGTYFNVHSSQNTGGEIRGNLVRQ
ncbi:MAG TPA: CHRD domain-containing protein [Gemmatimonadaceae bacterium]|nr:CHRD domain-containing protein [Gemmatimonadaceae bacterium]